MRLDHLLSKEIEKVGVVLLSSCQRVMQQKTWKNSRTYLYVKMFGDGFGYKTMTEHELYKV